MKLKLCSHYMLSNHLLDSQAKRSDQWIREKDTYLQMKIGHSKKLDNRVSVKTLHRVEFIPKRRRHPLMWATVIPPMMIRSNTFKTQLQVQALTKCIRQIL